MTPGALGSEVRGLMQPETQHLPRPFDFACSAQLANLGSALMRQSSSQAQVRCQY